MCPSFVSSVHNFDRSDGDVIFSKCITGFMSILIKKSWKDSNASVFRWKTVETFIFYTLDSFYFYHFRSSTSCIFKLLLIVWNIFDILAYHYNSYQAITFEYGALLLILKVAFLTSTGKFFIMSMEFDKKHFRLKIWLHRSQKWIWFFHETC